MEEERGDFPSTGEHTHRGLPDFLRVEIEEISPSSPLSPPLFIPFFGRASVGGGRIFYNIFIPPGDFARGETK